LSFWQRTPYVLGGTLKFFASRLCDQDDRGLRPGGWLRPRPIAAANSLDTNAELCGNGSQANSAGFVGSADGRTPSGMECSPTDRLAALGALGPGPCHAGAHPLLDERALKLGERTKHLKHRLTCRRGGIEALLMQVEIDLGRVQFG
jgi:hypothetical protein